MALKDLEFSDLILFGNNIAKLKGMPGKGVELVDLPNNCLGEITDLDNILAGLFIGTKKQAGSTMRYVHNEVPYRVAFMENISGMRTWFLRKLATTIPSLEELGFYEYLYKFLLSPKNKHGLILFCGSQATGKTTSASALIVDRLKNLGGHAVTLENPAELPLNGAWGESGYCIQSEINSETELAQQIECSFRYSSPNIIFIGEIRTKYAALEALRLALSSKEQLVVATIHGTDITNALTRLVDWAKEVEGQNAYLNLANSLLAVVQQDLVTNMQTQKKTLQFPEFLFMPFEENKKSFRTTLQNGDFSKISAEIRSQKNELSFTKKSL